jgi:hypothetical protein
VDKDKLKALLGIETDAELARYFGIPHRQTVSQWRKVPPTHILDVYLKDKALFMKIMEAKTNG